VEYAGDAVADLSVDERATMTNMTAEVGGFTGYVAPDEKTIEFLMEYRACRGMRRAALRQPCERPRCPILRGDRDRRVQIRPMIALPATLGTGCTSASCPQPVKVEIAYAGSCTAGKKEDMTCTPAC